MEDASNKSNSDGSEEDDEGDKNSSQMPVNTKTSSDSEETGDDAEGYQIVRRKQGDKKKELALAVNDKKSKKHEEKGEGTPRRQLRSGGKEIACNVENNDQIESVQEDFMEETRRKPKRKKGKSEKDDVGTIETINPTKWPSIRIRTAPKQLCKAIEKLSESQKKAVREMGMGQILKFRMDGIPARIGHFVVDKFDPEKMEIDLGTEKVKVDEEKIRKLLGLKNEGHILDGDSDSPVETAKAWRARYGGANVSRVQVAKKMAEDRNESGTMFKMDFIAIFGSVMVEYGNNEKIKLELMSYIRDDMDLDQINWNKFVIDALKRCKKGWDRNDPESRFTGPMVVLMVIYVDSISCSGVKNDRTISPITFWNQEVLKQREEYEIKNGGFGKGKQRGTYIDREGDDMDHEGCSGVAKTTMKGKKLSDNSTLEEHLDRLKGVFITVEEAKRELETALGETYTKFPNITEVKAYVDTYNATFKNVVELKKEDENKGKGGGESSEMVKTVDEVPKAKKVKKKMAKKVVDNTIPSFDLGIPSSQSSLDSVQDTQEAETAMIEKVLESYKETVGISVQDEHKKDAMVDDQAVDEVPKAKKVKKKMAKKVVDNTIPSFDLGIPSSQSSLDSVQDTQEAETAMIEKVLESYKETVGKSVQDEHKKDAMVDDQAVDETNTDKDGKYVQDEVMNDYKVDDKESDANNKEKEGKSDQDERTSKTKDDSQPKEESKRISHEEKKEDGDKKEGKQVEKHETEKYTEEVTHEEGLIDINRAANKRDRLLWQYLLACLESQKKPKGNKNKDGGEGDELEDPKEVAGENAKRGFMKDVFATLYGMVAKAYVIGSLVPGKKVDPNVVNCWAAILNFEEATVETGQKRLFLYTDTMNESVITAKNANPKRLEKFENKLLSVVEGDKSLMDMKSFKTIVVPIKDDDHIYIICFDLDVPATTVIESVHEGIAIEDMADGKTYASKGTPQKVKHVMWSYLQKVSHPKAMSLSATKPRLMKATWTTNTEYTDSAVYAMRNMEAYNGRTSGFNNGFRADDKQHEVQVRNIRMRYACKIMTSAANLLEEKTRKASETTNMKLHKAASDEKKKGAAMKVENFLRKLDDDYENIVKGIEEIKAEEPKKEAAAEEKKLLELKKDTKGKRVRFA
ncbi:hypothetical protein SSX86_022954 [Deinandra increscens subsp. villosa]|uniref:Ubiquitin-like protease family profile domain-containing protein n=1 Tax=Deinandra increscens subsp. villosa TaxID=3103831 RepID=A0AAP0CJU5_9ASTR